MERTQIVKLKEKEKTAISGFVEKVRDTRYMVFVVVKDITGRIQVSIDKELQKNLVDDSLRLTQGSVVSFVGFMQANPAVKAGGKEFIPEKIAILSIADAMPIDVDANIDSRLNYRWIDLRTDRNQLIFKVQSYFVNQMRNYLIDNDFIEIHTPKFIATASESGSEVFEVKYFDTKAYLSQSPQFYKQMAMASGFEKFFEVAPCFRAEKSHTKKHATEFTSFDVEFSYITSFDDVMNLEAEMIAFALAKTKEKFGQQIEEAFGVTINVPKLPFPKMKLRDVYAELEKRYGFTVPEEEKTDLTTEAERLCERLAKDMFGHEFLFVTDYPPEKRAFYHMRENGILQGYDLIWKGIEITSGAQREHRLAELKKNAKEKGLTKDVEFYLEFFKYGMPPHGGFAIGVDRITMLLLNLQSLKETQFLFRGPDRLTP
ncbi:MAG: aspartate--tRNA(Asn) ligase [Clostridia bacterium]|nr:aspartate--tRNA(Asn) ligase [Clostridia bacterium]